MNQEMIRKLQNHISKRSINSLGNVSIEDVRAWLDVSRDDACIFIDELHNERIIAYKYRFRCDCGEMCTVYEERLERDGSVWCEICGENHDKDYVKTKAEELLEINRHDLLELSMENSCLYGERTEVNELKKTMEREKKKMEIFIGSSSEAIEYMYKIALEIEQLNHEPLLWNAEGKGIFCPGENTIDAIIKISKRVNAAIFVFNADDKVWNQRSALELTNSMDAVRDNVLFEYGLFMGALGKSKVCFVCKGKPKLASDLKGITYIDGDMGEMSVKMKLKDWIENMAQENT